MREGKLLALDTPQNLKRQVIPGDVWEVFAEPLEGALSALRDMAGVFRVGLAGDHIRTITERGKAIAELVNALNEHGLNVRNVAQGEPTLEDVFLSLTG